MELGLEKNVTISSILGKRYILAFIIITSLIILSQVIMQITIHGEESDSRVINIAGRQRMLSQRISKAAFGLYVSEDIKAKKEYINELTFSVELWKSSHIALQNRDKQQGLSGKNSKAIQKLFADADPSYNNMLKASYDLISIIQSGSYTKQDLYPKIQQIENNEAIFLEGMDKIVFQYDFESSEKIKFIKYSEILILFIILAALLMEGIFIFIPSEKQIVQAFKKIEESRENLLRLFETAPSPMFLIDSKSMNIIHLNGLAKKVLELNDDYSINLLRLDRILKSSSENNCDVINKIKTNKELSGEEVIFSSLSNTNLSALISCSKINFYDKETIILGLSDITNLKRAEEVLKQYATTDELTGLLNKRSGMLVLENLFETAKTNKCNLSTIFIDIDGLKDVNDTYGHIEGDWYIKTIGKSIVNNMRSGDCAFRYGGDEIVLALYGCDSIDSKFILKSIEDVLKTIEKELSKPYPLSISYGIVDIDYLNPNTIYELIKKADELMYKSKKMKKSCRGFIDN